MKILVISQSNISVPPLLYGGSERMIHNLCFSFTSKNHHSFNLLAGKGSNEYNGKTLNYIDYRFGTSFMGRFFSLVSHNFKFPIFLIFFAPNFFK